MGGNISNKPPADSLPSECPVARKGRFHRAFGWQRAALCSVVCFRSPCATLRLRRDPGQLSCSSSSAGISSGTCFSQCCIRGNLPVGAASLYLLIKAFQAPRGCTRRAGGRRVFTPRGPADTWRLRTGRGSPGVHARPGWAWTLQSRVPAFAYCLVAVWRTFQRLTELLQFNWCWHRLKPCLEALGVTVRSLCVSRRLRLGAGSLPCLPGPCTRYSRADLFWVLIQERSLNAQQATVNGGFWLCGVWGLWQ